MYIYFCVGEKDVLEESIKKSIVKNIVHNGLSGFNIDTVLKIIDEISCLPNICLKVNTKIVISFEISDKNFQMNIT